MYLVCGIVVLVGRSGAHTFLCDVRPQLAYGGMGCGNTSDSLLMCAEPSCWRHAINITHQVNASIATDNLYQVFTEAVTDTECNDIITKTRVTDPISMVVVLATSSTVTDACKTFHCGVLENTMNTFSDLNSATGVCTNLYGSKPSSEAETCVCSGLLDVEGFDDYELSGGVTTITSSDMQDIFDVCGAGTIAAMRRMCSAGSDVYPKWCMETTVTTTTYTETTSTVTETETSTVTTMTSTSTTTTADTGRRLQVRTDSTYEGRSAGVQKDGPWDLAGIDEVSPSPSLATERHLQDATPAPTPSVANDELPEYETGDWSQCTCYQQCVSGVKTRTVDCLSDVCQSPKPAAKEGCTCNHAAQCEIDLRLLILLIVYFVQAACAFIVFLCFLYTLTQTEDDFIKLGFLKKFAGFFHKQLPPLIRILVIVQLIQVVYLVIDVWIGYLANVYLDSTYQKDCFASNDLRLTSQITSGIWVFGAILGKCTKQHTRRPDWLYSPERPSRGFPMKQFKQCFRCLGP
eukprot:CAMPEP_0115398994 /NCGR_PEP_ID=MMETSP0271-20121206/14607_1 /TAXON_ID=71861 /ORGANISM="Scrippsiella trochoidea, Strain CCMP3099" /LENGTH=517 /DNA_ID=CAMNT_0002822791 /DNA_START=151 /DNA_END=1704 /DNA_ORIENTATION=-